MGVRPPVPGGQLRTTLTTAEWEDCAYFRFSSVFKPEAIWIENRDYVKVEIFDSKGKSYGFLTDSGSLGTYGTQGDYFVFRYNGEP